MKKVKYTSYDELPLMLSVPEVAAGLGEKNLRRIYEYADVFHCEPRWGL